MFKFIYFPNRLAQLLCTGLIPAIDIGSDIGRYCRYVLVIAVDNDKQVYKTNFSCEWDVRLELAESLGAIPYSDDEYYNNTHGKIVGVLELVRCPKLANATPWTFGNSDPSTVYRIVTASLLDGALEIERRLRIDMLTYRCPLPYRHKQELFLPVSEHRFYNCYEKNTLTLPLDEVLRDLLFDKGKLFPYKYVTVFNNNRYRTFKSGADNEVYVPIQGDGQPFAVYSDFRKRHLPLEYFIFHLGTKI